MHMGFFNQLFAGLKMCILLANIFLCSQKGIGKNHNVTGILGLCYTNWVIVYWRLL